MHGVVFQKLQQFVKEQFGFSTWRDLKQSAGVENTFYVATSEYPDDEAVALVEAISEETGNPPTEVLVEFGEYIGPALVEMYRSKVEDEWDALDLIENTERTIHEVVRIDKPNANPPELRIERVDDDTVEVVYQSERRMCGLARGIATGVGNHYDQDLSVSEVTCMHDGHDHCTLRVARDRGLDGTFGSDETVRPS